VIVEINAEHPEPRKIQKAVDILERGGVIAYPTDAVYGIGCDAANKQAIEKLHQVKGMPKGKPLAFLCADLSDIAKYAVVDNAAFRLLKRALPGPYVFILDATREVPKMALTKQKTVGIRVPSHEVPRALCRALGRPILSSTANAPGEEPLLDPHEIDDRFPQLDMVLDGGVVGVIPSTIIDLTSGEAVVVREGAGPLEGIGLVEEPAMSRRGGWGA
jgi:tRNA threonylcarbamoyl adenosine modification protein (Sua5/YciO/YrdC/YwlC family)